MARSDESLLSARRPDAPPSWWTALFVAGVVGCVAYAAWRLTADVPTIYERYERARAAQAERLRARYGALVPSEQVILRKMRDESAMAGMAGMFQTHCARCHKADGSGIVGPNLTDDSWLHVDEVMDIYSVIREGVAEKGMAAWADTLRPTQMVLMSSYVASLRGQAVEGKAAEGKRIEPWPAVEDRGDETTPAGGIRRPSGQDSSGEARSAPMGLRSPTIHGSETRTRTIRDEFSGRS